MLIKYLNKPSPVNPISSFNSNNIIFNNLAGDTSKQEYLRI